MLVYLLLTASALAAPSADVRCALIRDTDSGHYFTRQGDKPVRVCVGENVYTCDYYKGVRCKVLPVARIEQSRDIRDTFYYDVTVKNGSSLLQPRDFVTKSKALCEELCNPVAYTPTGGCDSDSDCPFDEQCLGAGVNGPHSGTCILN